MTTVVASFNIKEDKQAEAEEALKEMAAAVEANEPGALAYIAHRSQKEPTEITFFEVYADAEAARAHRQTPHYATLQRSLAQFADLSTIKVDRLERIAGFVRADA